MVIKLRILSIRSITVIQIVIVINVRRAQHVGAVNTRMHTSARASICIVSIMEMSATCTVD